MQLSRTDESRTSHLDARFTETKDIITAEANTVWSDQPKIMLLPLPPYRDLTCY